MSALHNPAAAPAAAATMAAPPVQASSDSAAAAAADQNTSATDSDATPQASIKEKDKKDGKRRFFGLGKRKDAASDKTPTKTTPPSNVTPTISTTNAPQIPVQNLSSAPLDISRPTPSSPPRGQQGQLSAAASPARSSRMRSSSPRLHSPASSLIFERNVQESVLPDNLSVSGIPNHIQTEDHIPPVLEASSLAITDDHLNPDEVEIVMHSAHQPASEKVISSSAAGQHTPSVVASDTAMSTSPLAGMSPVEDLPQSLHSHFLSQLEGSPPPGVGNPLSPVSMSTLDGSDSYAHGSADPSDVRRLSFISFADVVQSEHRDADLQSSRDSMLMLQSSVPTLSLSGGSTANRSPSPVHSPASSHGGGGNTSPPTSGAPSMKGLDIGAATSAANKPRGPGSPTSPGGGGARSETSGGGGDIVVETMRQALRRTGSREFGGMIHRAGEDVTSPVSPAGVGEVR